MSVPIPRRDTSTPSTERALHSTAGHKPRPRRPSARCCNAHSRAHACTRKTTRKLLKESCTNRAHLPTPQSGQGFHVAFEKATRPASQGGPYVHQPHAAGFPPQAPATARSTRKSQRTTPPQPRHGTNGTHAARCCTRFTARGGATRGDSLKIQTRRSSCRAAHSSRRHTHTISRRTHSLAAAHAHASHHSIERDGKRRPRGVASNRRGGWRPITDTDIARTRGCADSAETRHFAQSAHPG